MMPRRFRLSLAAAVAVLVTCVWLSLLAPAASAHALLLRSVPADNATLPSSPARIVLTFTENPDPNLSRVYVMDSRGNRPAGVSGVQSVKGNANELALTVSRPLPKGWYTVQWLSVSTLDGHAANGLFVFGVGTSPPKVSPFGTVEGTSGGLLAISALGRWLLYLGLALLIGEAGTCLFVLKGSLPSGWRVLLRTAWLLAALGAATMTLAEQHIVGAPTLLPLFQTEVGHSFLVLTLVVVVGCGLAVVLVDLLPGRPTLWGLGATVALVMFIHAQAGHAYAPSGLKPLHFLEQLAHMLAVGIWVGGLVWLLLALRPDNEFDRVAAIRRFSRLAGYALGVVLLTGFLRAFNEIGSVRELLSTSYGRALLVKVALVVVIVGLGGLNRYRLVPALEAGAKAIQGLRRAVRGEVVVAMGILAATAVLAGLAPAVLSALGSAGPAGRHLHLRHRDGLRADNQGAPHRLSRSRRPQQLHGQGQREHHGPACRCQFGATGILTVHTP